MSPDDPGPPHSVPQGLTSQSLSPEMEAYFSALPDPDLDDPDNPEWTEEDFARAMGAESLPPEILAAFPNTLARLEDQGGAPPGLIVLTLDPDVIAHFKARGPEWRSRINDVLRASMLQATG